MSTAKTTPDTSSRLEDRVYSALLDDIRFGRFALGQRLPSENDLAQTHNVSRPIIRMALSRLRENGLIVSKQGSGSFVSSGAISSDSGFKPLASVTDIGAYFEFRRFIEAETARLAARNARLDDVQGLQACTERMKAFGDLSTEAIDPDFEFHNRIANLSNNRFLSDAMRMLRPHMIYVGRFSRSLANSTTTSFAQLKHGEHQEIVDAIERRDENLAQLKMVEHINRSERRVFKGK